VSSLTSYFAHDFNTQREQWEKTLLAELKLLEIGEKAHKQQLDGSRWPTLSLKTDSQVQLPSGEWKKASCTYAVLNEARLEADISEDLNAGVRNFFFHKGALNPSKWNLLEAILKKHTAFDEVEVFLLDGKFQSDEIKVISQIVSGKEFHDQGGHSIQELGLLASTLVGQLDSLAGDLYIGVYVDSQFFHNIAKIRAARLLALKILTEANKSHKVKVVALTSYQGWTLYERYSNMLRNETAVASAYIGGADHIQSAGYNTILELETDNHHDQEHLERSRRMARNTSHVLALESMLGVVEDAAFGSYHLESLTESMCENAWKIMQRLLNAEDLSQEVKDIRDQRLKKIKTRKSILSGTNDFPDAKENLDLKLKAPAFFRVARGFEELRLKIESMPKKPDVYVALFGDYGALNGRLNFVKNYFELLGLQVLDPGHSELDFNKNLSNRSETIVVLCSLDDKYPDLLKASESIKAPHKFIAGKYSIPGFQNLFAGQDIFSVLETLVRNLSGGKS
jgi:hypothetical protein